MLYVFGLYKCGICGKMVMGFKKEIYERKNMVGNAWNGKR